MLSNIVLGTQVIPFDVERYDPEKYQVVERNQIAIAKKPDEVPALHLAHEMVKYHIMNSGSYSLSPFSFNWNQHCFQLDSENNLVRLANGRIVKWGDLALQPGPQDGSIWIQTGKGTYEPIVHVFHNGTKEVHRWTLSNGRVIDCTWNHNYLTRLPDGTEVEMHIDDIFAQGLPLLLEDEIAAEPWLADLSADLHYPTDLAPGEGLKHIRGLEGRYGITNFGRVWSFNKTVNYRDGRKPRTFPAKWMPAYPHPKGYLKTMFSLGYDENGKQLTRWALIHNLVAEHFLPTPHRADLKFINHKDRNRANNAVSNLEWCNTPYNAAHHQIEDKSTRSSQYVGVSWDTSARKWRIVADNPLTGKTQWISHSDSEEEAANLYDAFIKERGWHKAPYFKRLNNGQHELNNIAIPRYTEVFITAKESLGEHPTGDIQVGYDKHLYLINGVKVHNSQIYTIISIFKKFSNSIVLSSCRVDAIARDPGLAQLINQFGAQNLTVAVEGISEKVCNFLQKSLMPEEFYVGMNTIIHQNFASVKMYYIYTGLEGEEDIAEFENSLRRIDEIRRKAGKPTFEMRMSFTPLLSTLGTPLQYHGSKVSRSLKTGSVALFKIKHICARYSFGIRLSSSIASSDFAQTVEFLDRRGQPLLEYLSLNGAFALPKLNLLFYRDAEEISKEVHDRLVAANRTKIGDKYYRVKPIDRITVNKLYALVNAESLFPEHSIYSLIESLRKLHGQEVPADILKAFPKRRREQLVGTFVKVAEDEGDDFVTDFGNGKKAYHMLINVTVNDIAADIIKSWIPLFTNGVTFNDVTDDKDALYIFPSMHIKFHRNRHIGQDFKQYVANRAYIFDSYCFNDALSKSLVGTSKVKVRLTSVEDSDEATKYMPYEQHESHAV